MPASPAAPGNTVSQGSLAPPISLPGEPAGMPAAEPANHAVAITMSLPVSDDTWRVRWKNLSPTDAAKVKVAVRVLCGAP